MGCRRETDRDGENGMADGMIGHLLENSVITAWAHRSLSFHSSITSGSTIRVSVLSPIPISSPHLFIFSFSHLYQHIFIFSSIHLLIFSSIHFLISSSSNLLIFSSFQLLIHSSSHYLICLFFNFLSSLSFIFS